MEVLDGGKYKETVTRCFIEFAIQVAEPLTAWHPNAILQWMTMFSCVCLDDRALSEGMLEDRKTLSNHKVSRFRSPWLTTNTVKAD